MTEAITQIQALTPLGAIIILAGVAASILTQVLKQPGMTKGRRQLVSITSAVVLGIIAYVVLLGTGAGIPATWVEALSTGVVIIAGVALMSRAAYALLGRTVPDGGTATPVETAPAEAPLVDLDAAQADAVHGRRRAEVRATHAPVDDA